MSGRYRPLELLLITLGFVVEAAGIVLLFFISPGPAALLVIVGTVLVVSVSVSSRQRIEAARRKLPSASEELDYRDGP